eukprot:6309162-Pyramimonas_sp.AAC.1
MNVSVNKHTMCMRTLLYTHNIVHAELAGGRGRVVRHVDQAPASERWRLAERAAPVASSEAPRTDVGI